MQQLHAQIATEKNEKISNPEQGDAEAIANSAANAVAIGNVSLTPKENSQCDEKEECESDNDSDGFPPVAPAQMWTKPDIEQFKGEVAAGKGEGIIKVSQSNADDNVHI